MPKKPVPKTLADRIRYARLVRNKMGSRQLDRAASLKPGHTAVIESRGDAAIESSTATKIAAALHVSLDWLLTGQGEGPSAATPVAEPGKVLP